MVGLSPVADHDRDWTDSSFDDVSPDPETNVLTANRAKAGRMRGKMSVPNPALQQVFVTMVTDEIVGRLLDSQKDKIDLSNVTEGLELRHVYVTIDQCKASTPPTPRRSCVAVSAATLLH